MKKLIFCDIDGTIIDGARGMDFPSEKTKYAFKELTKENYVFIASGRNKALVPDFIKDLKPNGYVLCNGAYAEVNNKPLFTKTFAKNDIAKLSDYVLSNNGFVILESVDNVYCDSFENKAFKLFTQTWGLALKGFNNYKKETIANEDFSISMVGFLSESDCLDMEEAIKDFADNARHKQFLSYDINIKGIDKGYAVKKVIELLQIPFENTYAFGDAVNDIEMLNAVKHPVMVANHAEEMKNLNFELTDDVLDDGFYNYLVLNKLIKPLQ